MRSTRLAALLAAVPLLATGWLALTDRPGLRAEHFALAEPWTGEPVHVGVSPPALATAREAPLVSDVLISIRWTGWMRVTEGGRHRFALDADDGAYLRIAGQPVADSAGLFGEASLAGRVELAPGLHPIEIGWFQIGGDGRLAVSWRGPGRTLEQARPLPPERLFAGRPLAARQLLRRVFAGWLRPYVQLLGVALLLAAAWLALPALSALRSGIGGLGPATGLPANGVLLGALVGLAFFGILPFTGTLRGGDDTAYLAAAYFDQRQWFFNRYAHVYLLKLFIFFTGGDPLTAVRLWWAAVFATTVGSLAVAARSLGPGLQLGTLAATLFVLFSQNAIFGTIGSAFADYSAMMFITLAVAIFLHGMARAEGREPPRHEWHALAIGLCTLAAFRSKEVGAVLLLLPALFVLVDGRFDPRRLWRRTAYWAAGVAGGLALLVVLDGLILGDPLFTFRGQRFATSVGMNFPAGVRPRGDQANWWSVIWLAEGDAAGRALRYLWVAIGAAAIAAAIRRQRLEVRLLHLLPIAYLLALIALYVRLPHPVSVRMLIPILPVGCLMAALLLSYSGLDKMPWRHLLSGAVGVATVLAAAVLFLFVVPYRAGRLAAADFIPATALARFGWKPDAFAVGVLLPAVLLILAALLVFVAGRRRARLAALVIAFAAAFGVGFDFNRRALGERQAAQVGDLLLFPYRTFRAELEADPPRIVGLMPGLAWRYHMTAQTRGSIAQLALRRDDVYVILTREPEGEVDVMIGDAESYRGWRRRLPALEATAVRAAPGLLILVRPGRALESADPPLP